MEAGDVRLRVVADPDVCIGAGNCAMVAPRVFDLDPDELIVVVLDENVSPEEAPVVRDAVTQCPSGAIALQGDG
jgi:ferredoxin